MCTFHLLVGNTLAASVTNNFLWFALTFWAYLETRSVLATAMIGGGYMLLVSVSGMFFGTLDVDPARPGTRCRVSRPASAPIAHLGGRRRARDDSRSTVGTGGSP